LDFFKKSPYESLCSLNRSNFLEMLKLLTLYNEIVLENASKNAKYASLSVQKEILNIDP
jgi:hypothetical protein